MAERSRVGAVVVASLLIGFLMGYGTEFASPWLTAYLGVSAIVIFGIGLGIVEGPTLISAIFIARKVTRPWVRSALQATGPFLGLFAYLVGYGLSRHPGLDLPFAPWSRF